MKKFKKIKNGTVTSPDGFMSDGIFAGLKSAGEDKLDLGILISEEPCEWADITRFPQGSQGTLITWYNSNRLISHSK